MFLAKRSMEDNRRATGRCLNSERLSKHMFTKFSTIPISEQPTEDVYML